MKIVVTGGAGFAGSHFVRTLLAGGYPACEHADADLLVHFAVGSAGEPVPLYGDGLHVREWLHVTDQCAGVQLVAERGRTGEVHHVGGGTALTDLELAGRLIELCGAARVDLDEGLLATVEWYGDSRGWWQPLRCSAARRP